MKKAAILTVASAILLCTALVAHAQDPAPKGPPPRDLLKEADTNQDGKVTYEEAKTVRPNMTPERFKALDRNKDGVLTKEEFPEDPGQFVGAALKKADADKDGKVTPEEFKAAFPKAPPERFAKLDGNKDGVISKADIPNKPRPPLALLADKADADNDGKVTFEEMKAVAPDITQERFNALDKNKDGVLTKDDRPARPQGAQGEHPLARLVQSADKDKDGKASFDEVKAVAPNMTQERFSKLDKNGDGFLTVDDKPAKP